MSLTTRRRSEIYEKLVPLLGEENAEAMMAEFPATEHDQLVTRDHLRAEMAELRGEMGAMKTDLRAEIGALRAEMHTLATRGLFAMAGLVVTALIGGMGVAAAIG